MSFSRTTATDKIFAMKGRIRAVSGGTSASKTISILFWLIDYAQSVPNELVSVVSESYPHLQDGAMRDFQAIMRDRGYWKQDLWHDTKHTYTFETGTKLQFLAIDTYGKAHGPRRDVLYINEANYLDYKIVDQLITRTRKIVWMDWNPSEEFWFYTDMKPTRNDVDFITLTYLDNEALDPISVAEIESHRHNKMWWQVYGLGQLGEVEGRIFTDWKIIDDIPHEARLERRGLDFGYAYDPNALVDIYHHNGGIILDERLYQKGMSNRQIAQYLQNMDHPDTLIVADSAEPKSIDELASYGVNVIGANKGPGSLNQGIKYLQDQRVSVTRHSLNLIKEYRTYFWKQDKNGKILNTPEGGNDHILDAARYGLESLRPRVEKKTPVKTGNLASMWSFYQ
jgi:phage terminase large subunit